MKSVDVRKLLLHRSPISSHFPAPRAAPVPESSAISPPEVPCFPPPSHECHPSDVPHPPSSSRTQWLPPEDSPRLLLLSENPLILLGRIQLSNACPSCCSPLDCLAFSDESATACCVLQEADPQILGRLVRVLSWSFIPKRGGRGGCLEIRQFEMAETSSFKRSIYLNEDLACLPNLVLETPPFKRRRAKSRINLYGRLALIGAPFYSPYGEIRAKLALVGEVSNLGTQYPETVRDHIGMQQNVGASNAFDGSVLGFFVGLTVCNHIPTCTAHNGSINVNNNGRNQEIIAQDLTFIYFSGSPAAWRPMLLTLSGKCVFISDLRKKILLAGMDTQYITYAATSASGISLLSISRIQRIDNNDLIHALGECNKQYMNQFNQLRSYIGVVSEIFVNGKLLELDGCIWLLLVHQPLSHVHGLRIGATVAAYNVHSLRLESSFGCSLLLATCSVSHVVIVRFSPYRTLYAAGWGLQSSLSCFIESLSFQCAFRALVIIRSLKLKFGVNEKEIWGSAKRRGIAENYLRSLLSFDSCGCREIFNEFFSHDTSCRLAESACNCFRVQVPSFNSVCKHIHVMWFDENSPLWKKQKRGFYRRDYDSAKLNNAFVRIVLSSDMLDIALLGILQFSKLSGRFQLVDATGAIDVVIPDLGTAQVFQKACQVSTYNLVIEGYLRPSTCMNLTANSLPLSYNNILKGTTFNLEGFNSISFFLIVHINELRVVEHMDQINLYGNKQASEKDVLPFQMLFILHKYPFRIKKSSEDADIVFCLEAVRLPYTLQLLNEDGRNKKTMDAHSSSLCMISRLNLSNKCSRETGSSDRALYQKQHSVVQHYSHHLAFLNDERKNTGRKMEKLLLQFKSEDARFHEVINIGHCYLIKCFTVSAVITVDSRCTLSSVAVVYTSDLEMTPDPNLPLVDIILKLPQSLKERFECTLDEAKMNLAPILTVNEVLEQKVLQRRKLCSNQKQQEICGLLKGLLVSFTGKIEYFQSHPFLNGGDKYHEGLTKCFFMKDLNNSCLVKVKLDLDFHVPPGFGPKAVVTMHRILLQLSPEGDVFLKCIPSTLIVVNSISADSCVAIDASLPLHKVFVLAPNVTSQISDADSMEVDALTDFRGNTHVPKLLKIQCQVFSVERVLFEKTEASNGCSLFSKENEVDIVESINYKVSSVFFTIDDGSGIMYCWAKDDVAGSILKIPTHVRRIRSQMNSSEYTIARELNTLLKKYDMIMMVLTGHGIDASNDNGIVFHTRKDQIRHVDEKKFLYAIVIRACHQGFLDIIGEHCEPETPLGDFVQPCWNNHGDIPQLFVKKVETSNYEKYLGSICGEVCEALEGP